MGCSRDLKFPTLALQRISIQVNLVSVRSMKQSQYLTNNHLLQKKSTKNELVILPGDVCLRPHGAVGSRLLLKNGLRNISHSFIFFFKLCQEIIEQFPPDDFIFCPLFRFGPLFQPSFQPISDFDTLFPAHDEDLLQKRYDHNLILILSFLKSREYTLNVFLVLPQRHPSRTML